MIIQYELVAPVTDRKAPYLDRFGAFIVPATKNKGKSKKKKLLQKVYD